MTHPTLEAGKYAAYVWPAYGLSALTFVWMLVDSLARARRWKARADERKRRP
jgi:heme exporter protein D